MNDLAARFFKCRLFLWKVNSGSPSIELFAAMTATWFLAYGAPPPASDALRPFHISPPAATLPGSFGPLAYEL